MFPISYKQSTEPKVPRAVIQPLMADLSCEGCTAQLVSLALLTPNSGDYVTYQAHCPLCGDVSRKIEIQGKVAINTEPLCNGRVRFKGRSWIENEVQHLEPELVR
jgi:hypothetical protein